MDEEKEILEQIQWVLAEKTRSDAMRYIKAILEKKYREGYIDCLDEYGDGPSQ